MFDRASLKLGLDKAVLQSMNSKDGTANASGQNVSDDLRPMCTPQPFFLMALLAVHPQAGSSPTNNKCINIIYKHNYYCYIASVNTKRDWLICSHVALDKCNVSRPGNK
jgi:hypothetical protein